MSYRVSLAEDAGLAEWRGPARTARLLEVPPDQIRFVTGEETAADLFAEAALPPDPGGAGRLTLPRRFLSAAEDAAIHRDPGRFDLLYRMLWRLRSTPRLMEVATDADVVRLEALGKAVRRDLHKMTAFVRFRRCGGDADERYVAWFEPDHHIVPRAAEFFRKRFTGMHWSVFTPSRSAHWNGEEVVLGPGVDRHAMARIEDGQEDLWKIYFSNIFNPARLKVKAMQAEMPKKYWKNLPETALIPDLVRSARATTEQMLQAPPPPVALRHRRMQQRTSRTDPQSGCAARPEGLEALRSQAENCRSCPLWANATRTVFGEGPDAAALMFVAEQPGDQEDLSGRPLVGPAGQMFDGLLREAGIERRSCYVTNAVKHFKYEPRGKMRLHKSPNRMEIDHCRWWLDGEIGAVRPQLIVALGASAAYALLGHTGPLHRIRGRVIERGEQPKVLVTLHPSALLRQRDRERAMTERAAVIGDFNRAREIVGQAAA